MSSGRLEGPGWTGDWVNGWLAAIGVTILIEGARLSWTDDPVPSAVFWHDHQDLDGAIAEALLTDLSRLPIAPTHPDSNSKFPRHVTLDSYRDRARLERSQGSGLLAASVTDLRADIDPQNLDHGAFDPSTPRGETLYTRAAKCQQALATEPEAAAARVRLSRLGLGLRIQSNGLGFDLRRLSAGVQVSGKGSKVHVDPVVELLDLAALELFPTRGNGRVVRQRGWGDRPTQRGAFTWPTWTAPLDRWAIDAILDQPGLAPVRFRSVPFIPNNASDPTRGYGTEQIR